MSVKVPHKCSVFLFVCLCDGQFEPQILKRPLVKCILNVCLSFNAWKDAIQSAKTSKPLTGRLNITDHLSTLQCSASKPCVLAFI